MPAAVVVLPAVSRGRLRDVGLRRWLGRGQLRRSRAPDSTLATVLGALGLPLPESGLAALRMWGQTGDRPAVWIAAADPVYLEPHLDVLCLHAMDAGSLSIGDMRGIFDHLQVTLADDAPYGFARIGRFGYLRSDEPLATATVAAYAVDQQPPNEFLPAGEGAAAYRGLVSEIEMALHDHAVNDNRQAAGLPPINSLWLWGGGHAPEPVVRELPPVFTSDPLLSGYWLSSAMLPANWPGSIEACLDASENGFVAIPPYPAEDGEALQSCLLALRSALRSKRLDRLLLYFRDGVHAEVRRSDALRFWRRSPEWLA